MLGRLHPTSFSRPKTIVLLAHMAENARSRSAGFLLRARATLDHVLKHMFDEGADGTMVVDTGEIVAAEAF